jgi:hypothetical protein
MTTTDTMTEPVADDAARNLPHPPGGPGHPEPVGGTSDTSEDPPGRPEGVQGDEAQGEGRPANREARYRREAREAQARVAELTDKITRMQEAEATRLAAEILHDPGDLILFGMLDDVLDADGMVDPAKVRAAAEELVASRPGLAKGAAVPARSFGQGRRPAVDQGSSVTWGAVLRGHE